MNCAVHTDQQATGYCRQCGKPLCPQCTREVRGALYCEDCLGRMLSGEQAPGTQIPGALPGPAPLKIEPMHPSAAVAVLLGFIPGLGAVYNGEYVKALIHVLVFGGLIAALSSDLPGAAYYALFGIALACFYFYMPIDAYRVAKARLTGEPQPGLVFDPVPAAGMAPGAASGNPNQGATGAEYGTAPAGVGTIETPANSHPGRKPMGAIVLIVLGVLFLLANFGLLQSEWFAKAWPAGLIALGVWLAWQQVQRKR
ncbi:MAG: B-box zinc finger protein [Candidatus Acidiferrales bacterium]